VFLAQARGFFERVNLDVQTQTFADSALMIPALVAGELDVAIATSNAAFFNAVNRGAPFRMVMDRGSERSGAGSMSIAVSNAMFEAGVTSVDKMAGLRGRRLAIQAPGAIDQWLLGRGIEKAGLDPRTDVTWQPGLPYPDIVRALGAGTADAANIPVPLAFLVERNNAGRLIGASWDIEPDTQLANWAMSQAFIGQNRSAAVRFCMSQIHSGRLYNAAAAAKDADVIRILSEATRIPPNLIEAAAPRWTWFVEDGQPNVESVMAQGRFWVERMRLASGLASREQIFDTGPLQEAQQRLRTANPFA
jgi:NitT/TauT family transport system substrate-binding protein